MYGKSNCANVSPAGIYFLLQFTNFVFKKALEYPGITEMEFKQPVEEGKECQTSQLNDGNVCHSCSIPMTVNRISARARRWCLGVYETEQIVYCLND